MSEDPDQQLDEDETAFLIESDKKKDAPYIEGAPAQDNPPAATRGLMSAPVATADTDAAGDFLKTQHVSDTREWRRLCLKLQREARRIPAKYATAWDASQAIPPSERITDVSKARRGMVGFCYDPNIPGTAGHVFFVSGWNNGHLITASNDVKDPGAVDYVRLEFYTQQWGHKIQFFATQLNGVRFPDFIKPPKPEPKATLGPGFKRQIDDIKGIRDVKRGQFGGKDPMIQEMDREIAHLNALYQKYKKS
jgi:hypothetical protein